MLYYPNRVEKFKKHCMEEFEASFLFQALAKLIHSANKKGRWTKAYEKKYNTTDAMTTSIMLAGDEKYIKKRNHATP